MEAEFHAGWIALRFLGDAKLAMRHFASLRTRAERPISVSRGAYWQGRAAESHGRQGRRAALLPAKPRSSRPPITARSPVPASVSRALPCASCLRPPAVSRAAFNGLLASRAIGLLYDINEQDIARALVSDMAERLAGRRAARAPRRPRHQAKRTCARRSASESPLPSAASRSTRSPSRPPASRASSRSRTSRRPWCSASPARRASSASTRSAGSAPAG